MSHLIPMRGAPDQKGFADTNRSITDTQNMLSLAGLTDIHKTLILTRFNKGRYN